MEILDKINGFIQNMIEILGPEIFFVAAIFMFLHCFFGYQLVRVWATIFGMLLGGAIGFLFATTMEYSVPLVITVILIAATAMGWVFYQIYLVGIFAVFAGAGFVLLHFLSPDASKFFVVFMMLLLGTLGVLCVRPFSILLSAALGGGLGSYFLLAARGNYEVKTLMIATCVLAALGIACQFFLTMPIKSKEEGEEETEKSKPQRPLIERIFVKPIENVQPEEIDHEEGLPSSEDLDRMIAEQLLETPFVGIIGENDFAVEEAEVAEEEGYDEEEALPDIPDEIIDEMIIQAIPDAEEYLPQRDIADEKNAVGDAAFDANAQNDFAASDYQADIEQPDIEADFELAELEERLEKGGLRTAEQIEKSIAALEESIETDSAEEKESIFSNPFKTELNENIELPTFSTGMSLAETAAALAALNEASTLEAENEAIAELTEEIAADAADNEAMGNEAAGI